MDKLISISLTEGRKENHEKINYRKASRGVILNDKGLLLMVHTKQGDYKFPGGELHKNETPEDALLREVREETGYVDISVNKKIASAVQSNPDIFADDTYFIMESEYYLCTINSSEKKKQNLDDYERDADFTPVYVTPYKALLENKKIFDEGNINKIEWLRREILFLESFIKSSYCPYSVKLVQKNDMKTVLKIINDGKEYLAENNVDQWQICTPSEKIIENDISRQQGFLIYKDDRPAAYEVISFEREEAYHNPIDGSMKLEGDYATIHRTSAAKEFRSSGISHQMFDFALLHAYLNKKKIMRIDTHKDNKIMQHIIMREGFEYVETVQFTESDRMRRIVFERLI